MLDKKIDRLRQQLNQMIITEESSSKRLLQKSQALDRLIVKAMLSKAENPQHNMSTPGSQLFGPQQLIYGSKSRNFAPGRHQGYIMTSDLIFSPIWSGYW